MSTSFGSDRIQLYLQPDEPEIHPVAQVHDSTGPYNKVRQGPICAKFLVLIVSNRLSTAI